MRHVLSGETTISTDPDKNIRSNIARAKTLLRREELIEALELVIVILATLPQSKATGSLRFSIEAGIDDLLGIISRMNRIQPFLPKAPNNRHFTFKYIKGKEDLIAAALGRLIDSLYAEVEEEKQAEEQKREEHRNRLLDSGQAMLDSGEPGKARVLWRRYLDEYAKEDPPQYAELANRFRVAGYPAEAANLLEYGIERFPREASLYATAIDIYLGLKGYEQAEQLYIALMRQFGPKVSILIRLANLYYEWRRKQRALDTAWRALEIAPHNEEVLALIDMIEGKKEGQGTS